MSSDLTLEDGARIAVIGGGPSGTLFSIFALKMAKMIDQELEVVIFEPKDFKKRGPAGCNHCGGVISEHLVQALAIEGINIPPEIVQRSIDSYVLHTGSGEVQMESPSDEKRIATIYRGGGPGRTKEDGMLGFDDFLLQRAIEEGAVHRPVRIGGIRKEKKPVLTSKGEDVIEADLVVGAFGVNSSTAKMFEDAGLGYKKPDVTSAFITEIKLGRERVTDLFGSSIHFFLLPEPKNIEFTALIPKDDYVTMCTLGDDIDKETISALMGSDSFKKALPEEFVREDFCRCFPKLTLNAAEGAFDDRMVVLGDAGSTRLFKDGIGAAYVMSKAVARTVVFEGIGKEHFEEHYLPVYNTTRTDNQFGRIIYMTTETYKKFGFLSKAMINVVRKEQLKRPDAFPVLSSILWDTFTGNESYRDILKRGSNPRMHCRLIWECLKAITRRRS
jgi:flavin-dependent dehydrogenase